MESGSYKPRIILILVIAVVIGQMLAFNMLKKDLEAKIVQCHEAVNMNTVLQGALVNILVEKNVIGRDELLQEAQKLSSDLKVMIDQMVETQETAPGEAPDEK